MATYYVHKVRKEQARTPNGTHEHIVGVISSANVFYSNSQVTESINSKNEWYTEVTGYPKARIQPIGYCRADACYHKPYLRTEADETAKNNLENLPRG